ncbi:hypothetical protein FVA81_21645 [Rhizobium sp. WL3]|uniref:hypothetical protein n=1 Tax=Rhizobium sp. WL3 TaxID=2603277 RepID=UPI0011C1EDA0|nr:hypothetical protein [Rhizobium sp. WL3]QEE47052.1 hypothetical protein FVA81_21645 [Rhizobium sp. WL3]
MLIRTYADIERLEGEDALSPAEKKLIENCKLGKLTTLGDGSRPKSSSPERAIRADLLRYLIIGGCERCQVHERGVQVAGAWIVGELDLSFSRSKGPVLLLQCAFKVPLAANQASFDHIVLDGSSLPALNADGAVIKGHAFFRMLKSAGEISVVGIEVGGQLSFEGADLNGGDGKALNAQGAKIRGGVFMDKLESTGEVSFSGAEIGVVLSAKEAKLKGGKGDALNAQGGKIRGTVFFDKLKSIGEVSFAGAEIDGQFSCNGAELSGGENNALNADSATIRGGVFLHNLKSIGEVSFCGAEIGVQLSFEGAELNGGEGRCLNAQRIVIRGGLYWQDMKPVVGTVDLNTAYLGDLVDDEQSWDTVSSLILVGATYEDLAGPHNLPFRKRWLRKGASPLGQFHPQPYQQLAKFYRETGHRHEAREILVEKEKEQRKAVRVSIRHSRVEAESDDPSSVKTALSWSWNLAGRWFSFYVWRWVRISWNGFWDILIRYIAGYGYKPWLSLGWLGGLVLIMMFAAKYTWDAGDFAPNSAVVLTSPEWKAVADLPDAYASLPEEDKHRIVQDMTPAHDWTDALAPGKDYETFYSFAYALDVVVPVLDLGQTDAWAPSPARGDWGYWMFYAQKVFIVLGWVVTAIAAAAISGMIRRDD